MYYMVIFFFKQKTAYEVRISDWSSDVCSSDLIVIVNGRIEQIGSSDSVRVPVDMDVINLKGKTIIPGLIDAHAHFNEAPRGLLAKNYWEPLLSMAFGVTTIRDPSNGGAHAFAYEIGRASCRERVGQYV